jgi:hypothetical protein
VELIGKQLKHPESNAAEIPLMFALSVLLDIKSLSIHGRKELITLYGFVERPVISHKDTSKTK